MGKRRDSSPEQTCTACGASPRHQVGIDWDWLARQYPATRIRLLHDQARDYCWTCGAAVGPDCRALPVMDPAPGAAVELDTQEVGASPIGEDPYRVEYVCDCGTVEAAVNLPAATHGTIRWLHSTCRACARSCALALNGSPDCPICAERSTFKPDHMGSPGCQSGSLASGGTQAHCTCDTCF